jgi:hypothetical protein
MYSQSWSCSSVINRKGALSLESLKMEFEEVLEQLRGVDEITILELLDITTEEILERFIDVVQERQEYIEDWLGSEGYGEEDDEEEWT